MLVNETSFALSTYVWSCRPRGRCTAREESKTPPINAYGRAPLLGGGAVCYYTNRPEPLQGWKN